MASPDQTLRLLTVSEAAKQLSLSDRTVRRMIASGDLPAVRLGRAVRVRQEDVFFLVRSGLIR
ncbi:MAG: helix-turn-helix domain-containing protein [Parvibaculaceae bacterium]